LRPLVLAALVVWALGTGCAPAPAAKPAAPVRDPLAIDAAELERTDPRCARKISESSFAYFRYTNRPFVDLVCEQFRTIIGGLPMVHAHGDAHLEQYAVAAEGRGLSDFDASAVGPPIVDLARFSTSLVLTRPNDAPGVRLAIDALLRGYERGLDDATATIPEPVAATRLRGRFAPTTTAWLDRVEKMIVPVPPEELPAYDAAWADFVSQIHNRDPNLDPGFFRIKIGGRFDVGIGSSHVDKFLVRIEGPTPASEDDLVMEAKGLEPGALGSCMRGADLDATRVITGQTQISNSPQRFLAAVKIGGKPFYSHTWLVHYTELATSDIQSSAELVEVSEDVGLQLGRGHAKVADPAQAEEQRRALRTALVTMRPILPGAAFDLAAQVNRSYLSYLSRTNRVGWKRHLVRH
jgi:hypothetical protein